MRDVYATKAAMLERIHELQERAERVERELAKADWLSFPDNRRYFADECLKDYKELGAKHDALRAEVERLKARAERAERRNADHVSERIGLEDERDELKARVDDLGRLGRNLIEERDAALSQLNVQKISCDAALAANAELREALERIVRFNPSYDYTFENARSIARAALAQDGVGK